MHYQDVPSTITVDGRTWTDANGPGADIRVWYADAPTTIEVQGGRKDDFVRPAARSLTVNEHISVPWSDQADGVVSKIHVSLDWGGRNVSCYYVNGRYNPPPKTQALTAVERTEFFGWADRIEFFRAVGEGFFESIWALESGAEAEPDPVEVAPRDAPAGWYDDPWQPGQQRFWSGFQWTDEVRAPQ